jgi:hypothetical protein
LRFDMKIVACTNWTVPPSLQFILDQFGKIRLRDHPIAPRTVAGVRNW